MTRKKRIEQRRLLMRLAEGVGFFGGVDAHVAPGEASPAPNTTRHAELIDSRGEGIIMWSQFFSRAVLRGNPPMGGHFWCVSNMRKFMHASLLQSVGTARMGQWASRITRSVVLPRRASRNPLCPCVGITMRLGRSSCSTCNISWTTSPGRTV